MARIRRTGPAATAFCRAGGHDNAGERADAHESGVAQAQLTGDADDQVQRQRHDDIGADRDQLALEVVAQMLGGDERLKYDKERNDNAVVDKAAARGG